jgi:uncharacterized FlaG/YvyC family protein
MDNKLIGNSALMQCSKAELNEITESIINTVAEGEVNALQAHMHLKAVEKVLKGVFDSKQYKHSLQDEVAKHGSKSFQYMQAEVQMKEAGVTYDYSTCNSRSLLKLQRELDEAKERLEEHLSYLKNLPKVGVEMVDTETGEVYQLMPPIKKSSTSVMVTFK